MTLDLDELSSRRNHSLETWMAAEDARIASMHSREAGGMDAARRVLKSAQHVDPWLIEAFAQTLAVWCSKPIIAAHAHRDRTARYSSPKSALQAVYERAVGWKAPRERAEVKVEFGPRTPNIDPHLEAACACFAALCASHAGIWLVWADIELYPPAKNYKLHGGQMTQIREPVESRSAKTWAAQGCVPPQSELTPIDDHIQYAALIAEKAGRGAKAADVDSAVRKARIAWARLVRSVELDVNPRFLVGKEA